MGSISLKGYALFDLAEKRHFTPFGDRNEMVETGSALVAETNATVLHRDALQSVERELPLKLKLSAPAGSSCSNETEV
jgi:hypothetical protein